MRQNLRVIKFDPEMAIALIYLKLLYRFMSTARVALAMNN